MEEDYIDWRIMMTNGGEEFCQHFLQCQILLQNCHLVTF